MAKSYQWVTGWISIDSHVSVTFYSTNIFNTSPVFGRIPPNVFPWKVFSVRSGHYPKYLKHFLLPCVVWISCLLLVFAAIYCRIDQLLLWKFSVDITSLFWVEVFDVVDVIYNMLIVFKYMYIVLSALSCITVEHKHSSSSCTHLTQNVSGFALLSSLCFCSFECRKLWSMGVVTYTLLKHWVYNHNRLTGVFKENNQLFNGFGFKWEVS